MIFSENIFFEGSLALLKPLHLTDVEELSKIAFDRLATRLGKFDEGNLIVKKDTG